MARVEIASMPWGVLQDRKGDAQSGLSATLKNLDGSNATTWSAVLGGSSSTASLTADANGNLPRFVEGGQYTLDVPALGVSGRRVEAVSGAVEANRVALHPLDYGAIGNGTTDDSTALASVVTAAASAGSAVLIDRPYRLDTGLTLASNVELEFRPGGILDISNSATGAVAITVAGSEGSTVALTANAAAGSSTLTVTAGGEAGLTVNDWVRVASNATFDPGHTDSELGELAQVLSTASGTITLRSSLQDTYNTADTAVFSKVTPRVGVKIHGNGIIRGSGAAGQHVGIRFDRTVGCHVEGIRMENVGSTGVDVMDSVGARVLFCHVSGSTYANNGYGVAFNNACFDCRAIGCEFRDVRHATSVAASATRAGIARSCWFIDCDGYDTTGDCFDTHASCEGIHYRNCHSYDSAVCGFNMESPAASFVGCEVHRSVSHGFLMNNGSARASRYKCAANTAVNCTGDSIRYSSNNTPAGAGSSIDFVSITDNVVDNPTGIGIRCSSSDTFRLKNITCVGNTVNNSANATAAMYFNKGDGGTLTGNHVTATGATTPGIRFNDWTTPTVGNPRVSYAANGSNSGGVYFQTVTNGTITGPAIDGAGTGIRFDNTCTGCTISDGQYPSCTTAIVPGTGTGHRFPNNSPVALSQTLTTDAAFTLQARVSPERTLHTGTLTAARAAALSTTGPYEGDHFTIARSGGGAFNLNVGTGPLKALATGQWVEVTYTNGAWAVTAFGSL